MTNEEKLTNLTLKQARILAKMLDAPARAMVFSQATDNGVVSSLSKSGFIEPYGRIGVVTRWKVKDDIAQVTANRQLIKDIAETSAFSVDDEIPSEGGNINA